MFITSCLDHLLAMLAVTWPTWLWPMGWGMSTVSLLENISAVAIKRWTMPITFWSTPVMSSPENHSKEGNKCVHQSVHRNVQTRVIGCHQPSAQWSPTTCASLCAVILRTANPHTHWKAPRELIRLLFVSPTGWQGLPSLPQWTGQDLACSQCSANTYLIEEQHLREQTAVI